MLYVTYSIVPQQRRSSHYLDNNTPTSSPLETLSQNEQQTINEFLSTYQPSGQVIGAFKEALETRRSTKWPELQKALKLCEQRQATLLILELGTLTGNESFTQTLLKSGAHFHCIDQPFVNQTILEALSKHAEVQRKLHGKLIREGLKMTSAKSGNPNAAEVINRVNKPKIDTAIMFAFLLSPLIKDYREKKFSQRQMVKALNEEGFTAPEGGKWVLSQLQKVLDRVRLNEVAMELAPIISDFDPNLNHAQMAERLNEKGITPLKQPLWDETQVKKLNDRLQQIQEITTINQFVLKLLPLLKEYHRQNKTPSQILTEFQEAHLPIQPQAV